MSGLLNPYMSGPPPVLWTPDQLGSSVLKLWLDGSNAGSITSSGGAVSQWNDLSGNANHVAQSTAGFKPTTGASSLNGLNVITFAGTDDNLNKLSGLALSSNDAVTIVCVRKHTSGTSGGVIAGLRTGSSLDVCKLGRDAGNTVAGGNGSNNSGGTQAIFADSDNTNAHVISGTYAISGTNKREIFYNGTTQATNTNAAGAQAAPDALYIGAMFNAGRTVFVYFIGDIADVMWATGTGATNRQLLEGYAAHKWGRASALDAGHPYKSSPPTL